MKETDKLKTMLGDFAKTLDDPEKIKALAAISEQVDKVHEEGAAIQTNYDKMKDDYIEALKHTSFKASETKEEDPNINPFDKACEDLRKELSKNG